MELAKRHQISRFQVARCLSEAMALGIVRIEIVEPADAPSPQALAELLGVTTVTIAPPANRDTDERATLAKTVARELESLVKPDMTVGLAWSRTLTAAVAQVSSLPPCDIVQLAGAIPETEATSPRTSSSEFIGHLTRLAPGRTALVFAPLIVDSAQTAGRLRPQPEIGHTLRRADALDLACVAIGTWQKNSSTVFDGLNESDRATLAAKRPVAEFCGRVIDAQGHAITEFDSRVIGVELSQLRAATRTVGVALGPELVPAVTAAAKSGIFSEFVLGYDLALLLASHHTHESAKARSQEDA